MHAENKSAIRKHSVIIRGHKTSISLEEPFWVELRAIAAAEPISISNLLRRIDADRGDANLSSAIRVHVLKSLRERLDKATTPRTAESVTENLHV